MYVYIQSESHLWTVGFYDPKGEFQSESDHDSSGEAATRVAYLNGAQQNTGSGSESFTKLEKAAVMIAAGYAANSASELIQADDDKIVRWSIGLAKAVIEEANKKETPLQLVNDLIDKAANVRALLLKADQDSAASFASTGALAQLQTLYQILQKEANK